jgi:hypothetical protein
MPRHPRNPSTVAASLVTIRLTPEEKQVLSDLVTQANLKMRKAGLPEVVCQGSFIRSLLERAGAEAGLITRGPDPLKPWAKSMRIQPARVSPKGLKKVVPIPKATHGGT